MKIPHLRSLLGILLAISCSAALFFAYRHHRIQTMHAQAKKYYEIGKYFHARRDLEHAIQAYQKTLACDSEHEFAHKAMGYAYLDLGDLSHAWEQFKQADTVYKPTPENPWWAGQNPTKKTILIQDAGGFDGNPSVGRGFGDCFQALRYVKELKKQQTTIIMQARPALIPLLSQCPYIDALISLDTPCPSCDIKTTTARLFQNFNTSLMTIPHDIPYMFAHPERVQFWAKKLAHDTNFKIGLCWNSQRYTFVNGNTKSTPHDPRPIPIEYLMQLVKIPHVTLYALQKNSAPKRINTEPQTNSYAPIISFGPEFDMVHGAFMDTAALMQHLDLIITVDTATAHLAGALGVPVWVLLPHVADWRWFSNRDDSPWYPTMRLFRQATQGDWQSVMHHVSAELQKTIVANQASRNQKKPTKIVATRK